MMSRPWPSRSTRANKPNMCGTDISLCLIKCFFEKLTPLCWGVSFESVLDVGWIHLEQDVTG